MTQAITNTISHLSLPHTDVMLNFCAERLRSRVCSSPSVAHYFSLFGRSNEIVTFIELHEFYLFAHVATDSTALCAQQNQQERNCLFPFLFKVNNKTIPHEFTPPFAVLRSDEVKTSPVERRYTICINAYKNMIKNKRLSVRSDYPLFSLLPGSNVSIVDFEFCPTFVPSYRIDFGFIVTFRSANDVYRADELLDDLLSMTLLSQQIIRIEDATYASK